MAQVKTWSKEELAQKGDSLENSSSQDVLRWALKEFSPDIALACSFGMEDVVLVDMVRRIDPKAKIFYLNTDLLFPETYDVRDRLARKYGLSFVEVRPTLSLEEQAAQYGEALWSRNPDLCCDLRKVKPWRDYLSGLRAWVTGIRRDQAPTRANAKKVEWDNRFGLVKVNPLVTWNWAQVVDYVRKNDVPYNALHDRGYPSIGCAPCTKPVKEGEDPRAGRWAGFQKTECGLHEEGHGPK